ncbi:MAG: leucyl aminopeptidase, partial [Undibacterium sp.]|nr:leucyl aminopeptidase [Undibacterium sp.]
MDFSIKSLAAQNTTEALSTLKTGCIVVGVFENKSEHKSANKKPPANSSSLHQQATIDAALQSGDFTGKVGSSILLRQVAGYAAERVLLIGLGEDPTKLSEKTYQSAVQTAARCLQGLGASEVTMALPLAEERDQAWAIRQTVIAFNEAVFRTDAYKSKKDTVPANVKKVVFLVAADEVTLLMGCPPQGGIPLPVETISVNARHHP